MDLIFLYGLPGVGKLTIAKQLIEKLEDYKLFHNQMTVDLISSFFAFGHHKWMDLNTLFRKELIQACAESGINLVVTFVFAIDLPDDHTYVKSIIDTVEQHGGQVHFVHLTAPEEVIFERIQNEDRKAHRKVREPAKLKDTMNKWDLTKAIPFVENFTIDTTEHSPAESAELIVKYFDLT